VPGSSDVEGPDTAMAAAKALRLGHRRDPEALRAGCGENEDLDSAEGENGEMSVFEALESTRNWKKSDGELLLLDEDAVLARFSFQKNES
jgi:hypothetical protein